MVIKLMSGEVSVSRNVLKCTYWTKGTYRIKQINYSFYLQMKGDERSDEEEEEESQDEVQNHNSTHCDSADGPLANGH